MKNNDNKKILLGIEAVAQAAMDAGIAVASGYPGTPSTEALEYIQAQADPRRVSSYWSANEKNAYGIALGASYNGRRAFCSMKQVGLNDCFDYFMSSSLTGAHGGLVLMVADDQGMASSQSEQDSRVLAQAANIPCFEPSDHQEAYAMTRDAFEFSEKYKTPIMIRVTAKLAHGRALVDTFEAQEQTDLGLVDKDFMLLPMYSKLKYQKLLANKLPQLTAESNSSKYNQLYNPSFWCNPAKAIVCSGIGYNYLQEILGDKLKEYFHYLKIGLTVPFPDKLLKKLISCEYLDGIYVFEEGSPFIERKIRDLIHNPKPKSAFNLFEGKVFGRESGHLSLTGNLQIEEMRSLLGLEQIVTSNQNDANVSIGPRLPQFCRGCPHENFFKVLDKAKKKIEIPRIYGDIGCYFLGHFPPYRAMDTMIAMGASIPVGMGAARAGAKNVLSMIGDSTLCHSGLPALREAAYHNLPMTIVIMDNGAVAMTGAQDSYLTGESLYQAILGLGVKEERIKQIWARHNDAEINLQVLVEEIKRPELSVIISQGQCVKKARMLKREKEK